MARCSEKMVDCGEHNNCRLCLSRDVFDGFSVDREKRREEENGSSGQGRGFM